jgi:hypothetical protein
MRLCHAAFLKKNMQYNLKIAAVGASVAVYCVE